MSINIAFAGAGEYIGTTTQALQMARYLMNAGYNTAYVSYDDYIDESKNLNVSGSKDSGFNIFKPSDTEKLKKYTYIVRDLGSATNPEFRSSLYLDADLKILVGQTKGKNASIFSQTTNKYKETDCVIFNFVPENKRNDNTNIYFADECNNPFSQSILTDIYGKIINAYQGVISERNAKKTEQIQKETQKQEILKQKYGIADKEDKNIIIEKKPVVSNVSRILRKIFSTIFGIIFSLLAGIGLCSLAYPETRELLISLITDTLSVMGL